MQHHVVAYTVNGPVEVVQQWVSCHGPMMCKSPFTAASTVQESNATTGASVKFGQAQVCKVRVH